MRTILFSLCITLAACGGKKEAAKDNPPPATKTTDDPVATKDTPKPADPPKPKATPKDLVAGLAKCSSDIGCDPFKDLVAAGTAAGPDLLAFATDAGKPIEQRKIAAKALGEIKFADAGAKLVELANSIEDDVGSMDVYEAAGKTGSDAAFDAMAKLYEAQNHGADKERLVPLRRGLAGFGKKAFDWAAAKLPAEKKDQAKWADVITDVAQPADKDAVAALVPKATDKMAANRLASKAIQLGSTDAKLWDPLIAALGSEDQYDRSDAGNFLADIADKVPADKKQQVIDLCKKALSGPKDPMLQGGLEKTLKKLGG